MSKIKVDTVTNVAGTGAPNIPDGITIGGVALASVNTQEHYAQSTEPSSPKDGAVWYDTDDDKAYVYINSEFYELTYTDIPRFFSGDRAVVGGGHLGSFTNVIQYFAIPSTGNATDFGDLTVARGSAASCSSGSRGVFGGGTDGSIKDTIDYVTIATTGNATDFGNLSLGKRDLAACSDGSRGVFAGGSDAAQTTDYNVMEYITISTTGNVTDFGDLLLSNQGLAGLSNGSRGVFGGGGSRDSGSFVRLNTIQYITIATTGNATDFGDLTQVTSSLAGSANGTRGLFGGGYSSSNVNVIQYITIASTGNATDFGDLTVQRSSLGSAANDTRATFIGGFESPGYRNEIDYVTIANTGNATDFGDLVMGTNLPSACSGD